MNKSKQEQLIERSKVLEKAKLELKEHFVGIDDVIDQFINSIESWFLYPELRTKPLIVNLWGITGVGKTDLIRRFVKLIGMANNYCELQADCVDAYYLKDAIYDSSFDDDRGVILIDEFQKLKTIDEDSKEIRDGNQVAVDLWNFLSDGSFSVDYTLKTKIREVVIDIRNFERDNCVEDVSGKKRVRKCKLPEHFYLRVYNLLTSNGTNTYTLEKLHSLTTKDVICVLESLEKKMETYENKVYSKVLIIISGNLDEAFDFSKDVFDSDTDSDIYNEMSQDIKIANIKRALLRRFRPEQIARLGNIHIIYPVLKKEANERLIKRSVEEITNKINKEFGYSFVVNNEILELIYKNGVYPTQGVRPIFSTISLFVENPIAYFVTNIIKNGYNISGDILLNYRDNKIVATFNNTKKKQIVIEYVLAKTLDSITKKKTENILTIHSVHEAGHAIVQAILFSVAPRQLISRATQPGVGGFCSTYPFIGTKEQYLNRISVVLAGRAAEYIVFGRDKITSGASSDLRVASDLIIDYYNYLGMGEDLGIYDGNNYFSMPESRDIRCEAVLKQCYDKTLILIQRNKKFLIDVADLLIEKGSVKSNEFIDIAKRYGYDVNIKKFDEEIEDNFSEIYSNFKIEK